MFGDTGSGLAKVIAGYHQFHAVRLAVTHTVEAPAPTETVALASSGTRRALARACLMAFYAGQVIQHPAMDNPTMVVLTDRNDLDEQLFNTFGNARICCARPRSGRKPR